MENLQSPEGVMARPGRPCGTGVLVLGGSSGRIDDGRVGVLAEHGALAMSIRWFGGPGQPSYARLVPLETFTRALDLLAAECDRLVIAGLSFGAEAALLTATVDPRVDVAVGFAPTDVAWSHLDSDGAQVSHWTWRTEPVAALRFDPTWRPDAEPPAFVGLYQRSVAAASAAEREAAAIPVERIPEVLLIAGGDDQVWPATEFADRIVQRRSRHGLDTASVTLPEAGHRTILPGEQPVSAGATMARGGSPEADRELGELVWPELVRLLRLHA